MQLLNHVDNQAVDKLLKQLEGGSSCKGRSASLCVLGRYNVGKTTLINALLSARWVHSLCLVCFKCVPEVTAVILISILLQSATH